MSAFDDATLVTDSDLSNWESKMPLLAQKAGVYSGKRKLAKNYLGKQLVKRGIDIATLEDPSQLKDAATFKELELIFTDLADNPQSIAASKALHYAKLFEDELELVLLTTTTPDQTVAPTISSIPLLRA